MNTLLAVQLVAIGPIAASIYTRKNVRVRRSFVLTALAVESVFAVGNPITAVPYALLAIGAVGSFFNKPRSNAPVARWETVLFRTLATIGVLLSIIVWWIILSFWIFWFL